MKKKKKSPDRLPEARGNISGIKQWADQAYNSRKDEKFKQEPFLQHSLSTEGKKKARGLKMSLLHKRAAEPQKDAAEQQNQENPDSTTPLISNPLGLPDELATRVNWYFTGPRTQPTMTHRSNLEAPTPMRPRNRTV